MSNLKYKISKIFFCFFILISILIFFACKAEKGETDTKEEVIASRKIFKSKNFSSEKQTEKFLMAVKKKDFKTIFDTTYYYQMKLSEIKSNNPKVLWEKLTTEYYEARKNAVLKGEKKSSFFGITTLFAFLIEPTENIQGAINLLDPPCKWKILESRKELKRDESSGRQYNVFKVYVSLNYSKVDESPLINGKLLKKRILSIYLDAKTGLYIRHYYVEKGDVYWKNVPLRVLSVSWSADRLMGLTLRIRGIGGTPPYNSNTKCGKWIIEKMSGARVNSKGNYISIDVRRRIPDEYFPLKCIVNITDKSGQRDSATFTVPEMFTGLLSGFGWVVTPWYKWGQGTPERCRSPIFELLKCNRVYEKEKSKISKLREELETKQAVLEKLKASLLEKEDLSQIIKNIQSNISNTRLRIFSFSPKPEKVSEVYIEKPYSISVEGSYHNLGIFFDQLSRLKKIFTVDILNITTIKKSSAEFTIRASFTASTYLYRKGKDRKVKKTQLENVLKTLENLERTKARLDKKVKIINQLKNRQKIVVKMMDDISNVISDRVWLNKLNFSHGALTISGKALSNNLIADFIKNMQNTNRFYNVRLNSSTRQKQSGLDIFNFSVKATYVEKSYKQGGE